MSHSSSAERLHVPGSIHTHPVRPFQELNPVRARHPRVSYPVEIRVRGLHLHSANAHMSNPNPSTTAETERTGASQSPEKLISIGRRI